VVATVIGHQRPRRRIVVDAGALALSKDRSTRELAGMDAGYGKVVDLAGRPSYGALRVDGVHQEHGEIDAVPDEVFERLPVGAQLRILPNHACMTAAMYPGYLVTRNGGIVARWARTNGWDGAPALEGNR
jgi:D-serine deaminase-like pyridoxal phosphate-dependent protein